MEGVLVGAQKTASTISTWVVSNAQGQYSFPRDRMEPGHYTIRIRAVGFELRPTSIDVAATPARLDLPLTKVIRPGKLATQLTNAELIMSVPGTAGQKTTLGGCVNCHTLQRVLFSRFDADELATLMLEGANASEEEMIASALRSAATTRGTPRRTFARPGSTS